MPASVPVPIWSTVLVTTRLLFWKIQAQEQIEVEGLNREDRAMILLSEHVFHLVASLEVEL